MEFSKAKEMMAHSKFYMGYSRWDDTLGRFENWNEAVHRVMEMHRLKYKEKLTPELMSLINEAEESYKDKRVLGSQRALQFGGEQLMKHESRNYNCTVSHCDRPEFFNEAMYLLLCGCGVGFSVQKHHVEQIPALHLRTKKTVKTHVIPDSIEGWADAFAVMLSSYLQNAGKFPEYNGHVVHFDYSQIRPRGAMISGGFKAPGSSGLKTALEKWEQLLNSLFGENAKVKLRPITAYDLVMHMSDAVLSGGVRRSATICLFDKDDEEMLNAKTGDWYVTNPQRGRSNNSAVLIRDELTREEWAGIMKRTKEFGEPGFIFTHNKEICYNPCVEIGMLPKTVDGRSGFQMCNLNEINGGKCVTPEDFYIACRAAAILGTLQAGYTNFNYLPAATREITEREALIGVSITGWMNNPQVLFDKEVLAKGAQIVIDTNKYVAAIIGINQAARTTCSKPSGNASVILGTASGIGGEHSPLYFRHVQMTDNDQIAKILMQTNPKMVEKSVWSTSGTDLVVAFPVQSKEGSIYKNDLLGVKQLEYVKTAQQFWVENGTVVDLCVDPKLRHNISNTITVDDWEEVEEYLYNNREWFAGVSLLSSSGDKDYAQAPFTEVLTSEEVLDKYGVASMFASGLIVDGLHAFDNNLWLACDTASGNGLTLTEDSRDLLKRDWVRRAINFANTYFNSDIKSMTYCLKDVHNLHKWENIKNSFQGVDFSTAMTENVYIDADTLGSQACGGGQCEVTF